MFSFTFVFNGTSSAPLKDQGTSSSLQFLAARNARAPDPPATMPLSHKILARCSEQLRSNKLGQDVKSHGPSSVIDDICKTGNKDSLNYFSILAKTDDSFDFLIHECLLILRDRPLLDSQQSSIPVALFESLLFHSCHKW